MSDFLRGIGIPFDLAFDLGDGFPTVFDGGRNAAPETIGYPAFAFYGA